VLIERGLRWRDAGSLDFTWDDCYAIITSLPPDSALHRAENPKTWHWADPHTDLLATLVDLLGQSVATQAQRPKIKTSELPKRIPRPWEIEQHEEKLRAKAMPIDELNKQLGW